MNIYLIDYENKKEHLELADLPAEDRVIFFYSQNSETLSFRLHRQILAAKANIEYRFVEAGGKNALDFQLSSFLGYLIREYRGTDCRFWIVSADKGFQHVSDFWKREFEIEIDCVNRIGGSKREELPESRDPLEELKTRLRGAKLGLSEEEVRDVAQIVSLHKNNVQSRNAAISKRLKNSKKVGAVCQFLKKQA